MLRLLVDYLLSARSGGRLALLAGLAACTSYDSPSTRQVPATVPPPPRPALPPPPLPSAAQLGYHRYVGTLDGRPVLAELTLELTASYPDTLRYAALGGSFYYRATGRGEGLGGASAFHPGQGLETYHQRYLDNYHSVPEAALCAEQPFGPLLTGWYTPRGQRQALPIRLREDYADAVRYEVLREQSEGSPRRLASGDFEPASADQNYLHLLGPDTLRPALARLQCPPPAARHRARLRRLDDVDSYDDFLYVTLNEGGLLAYTREWQHYQYGSRDNIQGRHSVLIDLHTGRPLPLAAQLRPGGLQRLRRLLSRQALADTGRGAFLRAHWWRAGQLPLPISGFEFTPTGAVATYTEPDYGGETYYYQQELSWAALAPLVRPRSPLQRLLRLRGL